MMSDGNKSSLKRQNVGSLSAIVGSCVVIAWCLAYGITGLPEYKGFLVEMGGSAFLVVIATWFSNIIPADMKHQIVFLRVRNALPGHRFIRLIKNDSRVDLNAVSKILGLSAGQKLNEKEQNKVWYNQLYKPVSDNVLVQSVHKSFLLYRDAGISVGLISVSVFLMSIRFPEIDAILSYMLMIQAVLLMIAANSVGKRFVTTAVVEAVSVS